MGANGRDIIRHVKLRQRIEVNACVCRWISAVTPIETTYRGYKFRSRLEARWAVFFDYAGIRYEYEPEGFDLDGVWYLPDFWLPEDRLWVEIKPEVPSGVDAAKLQAFHAALDKTEGGPQCRIIVGSPYYDGHQHSYGVYYVTYQGAFKWYLEHWTECPLCHQVRLRNYWAAYSKGTDALTCLTEVRPRVLTATGFILNSPRLRAAYDAARGARFERAS
jgi:hypothetical protein